jgi:hypothetical protein
MVLVTVELLAHAVIVTSRHRVPRHNYLEP